MEEEGYIPPFNIGKNRKIVIILIIGILVVGGIGTLIFYPKDSDNFTDGSGVKVTTGSLQTFNSIIEKAKHDGTNPNFRIENLSGNELFKVEHGGNVFLAELKGCDTIDTDASGKLTCGIDYDTNVTTMCSGDEVGLGNSSCFSIVNIDTTCDGNTCSVTNTGTLDGYEAAALLDMDYSNLALTNESETFTKNATVSDSIITDYIYPDSDVDVKFPQNASITGNNCLNIGGGSICYNGSDMIWD